MGFYGVFHQLFYCIKYLIPNRALGIGSVSDSIGDLHEEIFGKSGITQGAFNGKNKSQKSTLT